MAKKACSKAHSSELTARIADSGTSALAYTVTDSVTMLRRDLRRLLRDPSMTVLAYLWAIHLYTHREPR
jgi:hypothetical protein